MSYACGGQGVSRKALGTGRDRNVTEKTCRWKGKAKLYQGLSFTDARSWEVFSLRGEIREPIRECNEGVA